jgi:hypothetical protein
MTREQALDRLNGNDLLQLGMDADDARQTLWPEAVVTYTVGYPLSVGSDAELGEVAAAITRGATGLVLSARQSPSLNSVLADVTLIHRRFPDLTLTGFSPSGIAALGNPADVFQELKSAGLALFGNAAEAAHTDWVAIHRAAHRAGLPSIAVLTLRSSDSAEDWVSLLDQVALLQSARSTKSPAPSISRWSRSAACICRPSPTSRLTGASSARRCCKSHCASARTTPVWSWRQNATCVCPVITREKKNSAASSATQGFNPASAMRCMDGSSFIEIRHRNYRNILSSCAERSRRICILSHHHKNGCHILAQEGLDQTNPPQPSQILSS